MTETYAVTDNSVKAQMAMHDMRDTETVHTNLDHSQCACRQPQAMNGSETVQPMSFTAEGTLIEQPRKFAASTGDACHACGGITVRTGTCHTCTECGTTSGCG